MDPTEPKLLTVSEAADFLAVSDETIRRLIRAGTLPALQIGPHSILRQADLEAEFRRRYPGFRRLTKEEIDVSPNPKGG